MAQDYKSWGWSGSGYTERIYFEVTRTGTDNQNNRSSFRCRVWNNSNNSYGDTGSMSWTVADNWSVRRSNSSVNKPTTAYNQTIMYDDFTFWISHNYDGTLGNVTFELKINRAVGNVRSATVYVTVTGIPTIPRNSKLTSLSNASVPSGSPSFTIEASSPNFTHIVDFRMNNKTLFNRTGLKGGTHSFSLTTAEKNAIIAQMTNVVNATFTVVLGTYNNGVWTGEAQSRTATISIDESIIPTINSVTISEAVDAVKNNFSVYIRGKSQIKVDVTRSAGQSSSISSTQITIGSQVFSNSVSATSSIINSSGTLYISVRVTDARGRTATSTKSITIVEYTAPIINSITAMRSTSSGAPLDDSTIITVKFKYTCSSVSSQNTASFLLRYRVRGTQTWTNWTSGSGVTGDKSYTSSAVFNSDIAYDVDLVVSDKFVSITRTTNVPTAFTLIDFNASGKGMALGKVSSKNEFEVALPLEVSSTFKRVVPTDNAIDNHVQTFYRKDGSLLAALLLNENDQSLRLHRYDKSGGWASYISFNEDSSINGSKLVTVVETGSNYRKYSDGKMEQWGSSHINLGGYETETMTGVFRTNVVDQSFPIPFVGIPPTVVKNIIRISGDDGWEMKNGAPTLTHMGAIMLVRLAKSTTAMVGRLTYRAVGYWK